LKKPEQEIRHFYLLPSRESFWHGCEHTMQPREKVSLSATHAANGMADIVVGRIISSIVKF